MNKKTALFWGGENLGQVSQLSGFYKDLVNFFRRMFGFSLLAFQGFRVVFLDLGSGLGFQGFWIGLSNVGFFGLLRIGFLSLLKQRWNIPHPK